MDSSRRQSGIQQLLAAEQEAQRIVNEARNGWVILYLSRISIKFLVLLVFKKLDSLDMEKNSIYKNFIYYLFIFLLLEELIGKTTRLTRVQPCFPCITAKMARLKQAKEEADKEIAAYRAQMEAEFQRKVAQASASHPLVNGAL
ncbi:unnamed protein product [Musa textilis]